MTHHTSPHQFAEAAEMAEAMGLYNIAEANWRLAAMAASKTTRTSFSGAYCTTNHMNKENAQ